MNLPNSFGWKWNWRKGQLNLQSAWEARNPGSLIFLRSLDQRLLSRKSHSLSGSRDRGTWSFLQEVIPAVFRARLGIPVFHFLCEDLIVTSILLHNSINTWAFIQMEPVHWGRIEGVIPTFPWDSGSSFWQNPTWLHSKWICQSLNS